MNKPLVSIILLSYNRKELVSKTLDSILMQRVDFEFELLIGDDNSTDGVTELLKAYQARYPDIIKLHLYQQNEGLVKNCYRTFCFAKGEYIAFCDNDDIWLVDDKLQKAVDFLQINKNVVMHTSLATFNGRQSPMQTKVGTGLISQKEILDNGLEDITPPISNWLVRTAALKHINFLEGCFVHDYPIYLMIAISGDIFIDESITLDHYELPDGWTEQNKNSNLFHAEGRIDCAERLRKLSHNKYDAFFDKIISKQSTYIFRHYTRLSGFNLKKSLDAAQRTILSSPMPIFRKMQLCIAKLYLQFFRPAHRHKEI